MIIIVVNIRVKIRYISSCWRDVINIGIVILLSRRRSVNMHIFTWISRGNASILKSETGLLLAVTLPRYIAFLEDPLMVGCQWIN